MKKKRKKMTHNQNKINHQKDTERMKLAGKKVKSYNENTQNT